MQIANSSFKKNICLKRNTPEKDIEELHIFDFETVQRTLEHEVSFAMAMKSSGQVISFKEYNACEDFCGFLISESDKGFTAIALIVKALDGQFALAYLLKQVLKPKIAPSGSKIPRLSWNL